MISSLIFRGSDGQTHSISEADYKQRLIDNRRDEFVWSRSGWGGKAHVMIPREDFSVTLCKKMIHGTDYWPDDEEDDRCKTCTKVLAKEQGA